jgi:hypothetical protein
MQMKKTFSKKDYFSFIFFWCQFQVFVLVGQQEHSQSITCELVKSIQHVQSNFIIRARPSASMWPFSSNGTGWDLAHNSRSAVKSPQVTALSKR